MKYAVLLLDVDNVAVEGVIGPFGTERRAEKWVAKANEMDHRYAQEFELTVVELIHPEDLAHEIDVDG